MSGPPTVAPLGLWPGRVPRSQARAKVQDSRSASGVTMRDARTLDVVGYQIPTAETAAGRTIRVHEALHGQLRPWELPCDPKYHDGITQIIEDVRVQLSFPTEPAVMRDALATTLREERVVMRWLESPEGQAALAHGVPWQALAGFARAQATRMQTETAEARTGKTILSYKLRRDLHDRVYGDPLARTMHTVASYVQEAMTAEQETNHAEAAREAARDQNLARAADLLQTMLAPEPEQDEQNDQGEGAEGESGASGMGDGAEGPEDGSTPGVGAIGADSTPAPKTGARTPVGEKANTDGKLPPPREPMAELLARMHMDIVELAPRMVPTKRMRSPSWMPGSTGPRMRMALATRALAGQNAFGLFRRRKNSRNRVGTVLIDASGSMGVTQQRLLELLQHAPGAALAFYSGQSGSRGTLAIWSRNGKCYNGDPDKMPIYNGNTVDLPALLWLLKQRGPLIFVTDRGFCGGPEGADQQAHALLARAELRGQVTVIGSLQEAKERFEKVERTGGKV